MTDGALVAAARRLSVPKKGPTCNVTKFLVEVERDRPDLLPDVQQMILDDTISVDGLLVALRDHAAYEPATQIASALPRHRRAARGQRDHNACGCFR